MRPVTLFFAAVMLAPPAQALAQSNVSDEVDVYDDHQNGGGESKLGLLGLLGLAGLFGLRRREPDIHVDARRERR